MNKQIPDSVAYRDAISTRKIFLVKNIGMGCFELIWSWINFKKEESASVMTRTWGWLAQR
jgi:hypothetical protein